MSKAKSALHERDQRIAERRGGGLMSLVVLFCGGRGFENREAIKPFVLLLPADAVVVHGDCPTGADRIVDTLARERKLRVWAFPADWQAHGRAAGPIRNAHMLDTAKPDAVVAFPSGISRGTRDTMRRAGDNGIAVFDGTKGGLNTRSSITFAAWLARSADEP